MKIRTTRTFTVSPALVHAMEDIKAFEKNKSRFYEDSIWEAIKLKFPDVYAKYKLGTGQDTSIGTVE